MRYWCFDFRSNFLVSISFLINIETEISLPGFRRNVLVEVFAGSKRNSEAGSYE